VIHEDIPSFLQHPTASHEPYRYTALRVITFCFTDLNSKKEELSIHEHILVGALKRNFITTGSSRQLLSVQSRQIKLAVTLRRAKEKKTGACTFLPLCLRHCSLQLLLSLLTGDPADEVQNLHYT
jgi:hypothetical protein